MFNTSRVQPKDISLLNHNFVQLEQKHKSRHVALRDRQNSYTSTLSESNKCLLILKGGLTQSYTTSYTILEATPVSEWLVGERRLQV